MICVPILIPASLAGVVSGYFYELQTGTCREMHKAVLVR